MAKTFSAYISNDELVERIEKQVDDGRFHNFAHFFQEAAEKLCDEEESSDMIT